MSNDTKTALQGAGTAKPSDEQIQFERDRRIESGKAARRAIEIKKKARELREAAAAAGDPDERQKLLKEAVDKEIEAESFGKVAKYLRSGTFQGMVAGLGLGVVPGATLGALTGTLVGGTVSLITGGVGAAGGALTGWLHGPFFDLAEVATDNLRKLTGDIPGWKATKEQKKQLEKMIGQVKEEEMPEDDALQEMAEFGDEDATVKGIRSVTDLGQGIASAPKNLTSGTAKTRASEPAKAKDTREADRGRASNKRPAGAVSTGHSDSKRPVPAPHSAAPSPTRESTEQSGQTRSRPVKSNTQAQQAPRPATRSSPTPTIERKMPRKLEVRSAGQSHGNAADASPSQKRRTPRKLERRS